MNNDANGLLALLEALLFASGEPIEISRLSAAAGIDIAPARELLTLLGEKYDENGSGIQLLALGEYYQLATRPQFEQPIRQLFDAKRNSPLSAAALEVLAIVAYNQPVSKSFIESVRGIDSSSVVNSLVEKDLLYEAGRLSVPGKPIAYATTPHFLRCFSLSSLDELPELPSADGQLRFIESITDSEESPLPSDN